MPWVKLRRRRSPGQSLSTKDAFRQKFWALPCFDPPGKLPKINLAAGDMTVDTGGEFAARPSPPRHGRLVRGGTSSTASERKIDSRLRSLEQEEIV